MKQKRPFRGDRPFRGPGVKFRPMPTIEKPMPKNTYPKLHNAMWPGLVGKEAGTDHPPIGLDRMLELTVNAEVNGQKFDGDDLFLFDLLTDPDVSDDDIRRMAYTIARKALNVGSVV